MTLQILDWKSTKLLASPVKNALEVLPPEWIIGVTENESDLADTYKWVEAYGVSLDKTANVVVLETRKTKNSAREFAAVLILADSRADLNGIVKRTLGIYKASFASTEKAVTATSMESGGMSPIGLPVTWPLLIDQRVIEVGQLYLGSGIRSSKLVVNGALLRQLPNAHIVDDLAKY